MASKPSEAARQQSRIALRHNLGICAEMHQDEGTGTTLSIPVHHVECYATALEDAIFGQAATIGDYNKDLKATHDALLDSEEDPVRWDAFLQDHFMNTSIHQSSTSIPGIGNKPMLSLDMVTQARAMLLQSVKVINDEMESRARIDLCLKPYRLSQEEEEVMAQKLEFWRLRAPGKYETPSRYWDALANLTACIQRYCSNGFFTIWCGQVHARMGRPEPSISAFQEEKKRDHALLKSLPVVTPVPYRPTRATSCAEQQPPPPPLDTLAATAITSSFDQAESKVTSPSNGSDSARTTKVVPIASWTPGMYLAAQRQQLASNMSEGELQSNPFLKTIFEAGSTVMLSQPRVSHEAEQSQPPDASSTPTKHKHSSPAYHAGADNTTTSTPEASVASREHMSSTHRVSDPNRPSPSAVSESKSGSPLSTTQPSILACNGASSLAQQNGTNSSSGMSSLRGIEPPALQIGHKKPVSTTSHENATSAPVAKKFSLFFPSSTFHKPSVRDKIQFAKERAIVDGDYSSPPGEQERVTALKILETHVDAVIKLSERTTSPTTSSVSSATESAIANVSGSQESECSGSKASHTSQESTHAPITEDQTLLGGKDMCDRQEEAFRERSTAPKFASPPLIDGKVANDTIIEVSRSDPAESLVVVTDGWEPQQPVATP
jgi:hypothetical protein